MKYRAKARRTAKSRKQKYFGKQNQKATDVLVDATAIPCEDSVVDGGETFAIGENNLPSTPSFNPVPSTSKGDGTGLKVFKTLSNKSEEKLKNSCFSMLETSPTKRKKTRSVTAQLGLSKQKEVRPSTGYKIVDFSLLQADLVSFLVCGKCKRQNSIRILSDKSKPNYGLAENFILKCIYCKNEKLCWTSKKTVQEGRNSRKASFYDVNIRSVLASQAMGYSQLSQFCATMDLPQPVWPDAYNRMQKKLCTYAQNLLESIMKDAAKHLFDITKKEEPENVVMTEYGELAHILVTVDGTWQRRGHNSKNGVVFVLSVETGEVLDFVVKSIVCQECTMHDKNNKTSEENMIWKENHYPHCNVNHEDSAARMESDGTIEIFQRSIDTRKLIYSTYVGDGDSGSFSVVKNACLEKYGELYMITKEECVGHIQKRMGS